jgi:hypothetical protein
MRQGFPQLWPGRAAVPLQLSPTSGELIAFSAPTGRPPSGAQVLAHVCEVVRAAPGGAERRSVLWGARRVILAVPATLEREAALQALASAAAAVGVPSSEFESIAASAGEIAGRSA